MSNFFRTPICLEARRLLALSDASQTHSKYVQTYKVLMILCANKNKCKYFQLRLEVAFRVVDWWWTVQICEIFYQKKWSDFGTPRLAIADISETKIYRKWLGRTARLTKVNLAVSIAHDHLNTYAQQYVFNLRDGV